MAVTTRHRGSLAAVGLLAAGLGGCVEQFPEAQLARGDVRNAIAHGSMTSPKAATVALVSIAGAPAPVEAAFRTALAGEAAAREIAITDAVSARYLVRGYLSAYPTEAGGVEVAYTYDLFGAGDKRRQQRIADTLAVPGGAADPWAAVTPAVVASLASRGADELAVGLGGMPEARGAGQLAAAPAGPVQPAVN